jgi:hypothetical protein
MKIVRLFGITAIFFTSCAPGELDPSLGRPGRPDAGGGTGSEGGEPPAEITEDTPLPGCERFRTIGEFEQKLVVAKCGTSACHAANGKPFAPDMKGLPIFPRLVNRKVQYVVTTCDKENDLYIDEAGDPEKSYLVSKVRDVAPLCGSGRKGGVRMPFLMPALPDDEIACFVSYVRAVTRH